MIYRIFSNGRGVITSREEEVVRDKIVFCFERAPKHATAIVTFDDGTSYYRELHDGNCSITKKNIEGHIGVALAILNGETPVARWECERIKVEQRCDGSVALSPDYADLPEKFALLQMELEEERLLTKSLIENIDEFKKEIRQFREEFDRLYKGYQVI